MFGNAIRNTALSRSVATKGSTPLKMVVKLTSLARLLVAKTFTVNQPDSKEPGAVQTILELLLRSPGAG